MWQRTALCHGLQVCLRQWRMQGKGWWMLWQINRSSNLFRNTDSYRPTPSTPVWLLLEQ
uniref:Uncharacterized protein n=1 Tax=Anopheles atroparvus TaxID=41427 RepID=A0AAG5CXY6_ANOAO